MHFLWALLLVIVVALSWLAQLVGLPGNWFIVAAVACYTWWVGPDVSTAVDWYTVIALIVLATAGELIELAASAMGVAKVGGSRRGVVLAIVGSIIGSIVGVFVGIPVPVVGSLIAAVLFGGIGALVGAFLGESWHGHDFDTSLEIGKAAFVGRLLGTLGKLAAGTIMVVVTYAALVL